MSPDYLTLVKNSYVLIQTLQLEKDEKNTYSIKSRGKVRNLANAFQEFDDSSKAVEKFIEYTRTSLTHGNAKSTFEELLKRLFYEPTGEGDTIPQGIVTAITSRRTLTPDAKRSMIQYILGYMNWGADSVCAIFSAYPDDDTQVRKRLNHMVNAEFAVLWEGSGSPDETYKQNLVNGLLNLKINADSEFETRRKNHV